MRSHLRYSWAALVAAMLGCDSSVAPVEPPVPGPAAQMAAVSGTAFTGLAGSVQTLQVKVTDAKGMNVPGVSVSWKVISGEGGISPATTTTDAEGIAEANWTLGAWADSQKVQVKSGSLAPVTFTALVPTASLIITPAEVRLWVGDTAHLETITRDVAGTVLGGIRPTWLSSNSEVAKVDSAGFVTGTNYGKATVTAKWREVSATAEATVLHVLLCKVWALGGGDVGGHRCVVEWEEQSAAAAVSAMSDRGEATIRLPELIPPTSSIRVYVDRIEGARRFHPSVVFDSVGQLPAELLVGLVPLRFDINFGCYAGQSIEVSAREALTSVNGDIWTPFYAGVIRDDLFGVPAEILPMPVEINPAAGATAADADVAWEALVDFAHCVWPGEFYRRVPPGTLAQGQPGLKVSFDANQRTTGYPTVIEPGNGTAVLAGAVWMSFWPSDALPGFKETILRWFLKAVQHETVHAMGFGHAPCTYYSVMSSGFCGSQLQYLRANSVTPQDVAYMRLMQLAYELRRAHGIPPENFFLAASRGEEVFGR